MSGGAGTNTSIRKMISALLLLGLLAFLLSIYFLKYVPAQRSDFNRRAFLELSQIEKAIQERNKGYIGVITGSIDKITADSIGTSQLSNYFKWRAESDALKKSPPGPQKNKNTLAFSKISFNQNGTGGDWQLCYELTENDSSKRKAGCLSKNVDSIFGPLVSTYKDIFADYLLILDSNTNTTSRHRDSVNNNTQKGIVMFNSGHLSVDYLVNMDTLLKKTDGFSLLNVHDVKIEGNPYKLFLYPFRLNNQRVVLAGLTSLPHYLAGSESVPIDLLTIGCVLILLLFLNLPLLKVYIIGPIERVTSLDIRMIIVSYFLAAFMLFFLFFLFFLSRNQTAANESALKIVGENVEHNFFSEINDICHQLGQYDTLYAALHLRDTAGVHSLLTRNSSKNTDSLRNFLIAGLNRKDIGRLLPPLDALDAPEQISPYTDTLDAFFHPGIYPRMDLVFWISDSGRWTARWAFKKQYRQTHKLDVADRQYFKDMISGNLLTLPPPYDPNYTFAIQPTLSRLNGDYIVTVVIKSNYADILDSFSAKAGTGNAGDSAKPAPAPRMLGLSAEMHSIYNTVMPPGYNFSIINNEGDILYDSKPGRSLLSNLFVEAGDNTDIEQCARYRYNRFFKKFTLKGKEVALLSRPLPGLPYTLIVSYNLAINNEFQFHSLCLACFCMACILALIGLIAFVNEWAKKTPTLLGITTTSFDWLRPIPGKMNYYKHQIRWMGHLFGIYAGAWLFVGIFFPHEEPCLFIISLSFPFFVAYHYYTIRESYYIKEHKRIYPQRLPYSFPLGLILLSLLVYTFASKPDAAETIITISVFFIFGITIHYSSGIFFWITPSSEEKDLSPGLLRRYVWAILLGVFLITLAPATGFFALFYKVENNSELKMLKLNMARAIQKRRCDFDKKIPDYSFKTEDSLFLFNTKFRNGIYFLDGLPIEPFRRDTLSYHIFSGYGSLHELLFSIDSTTLEPPGKKEAAGDNSWHFYRNKNKDTLTLFYKNKGVTPDHGDMYLPIDPVTQKTALGLLLERIVSMDALSLFLATLGLLTTVLIAYHLTFSLARHIFLIDILTKYKPHLEKDTYYLPSLKCYPEKQQPIPFPLSPECIEVIAAYEKEVIANHVTREADIIQLQYKLERIYDKVWAALPTDEKYILYDFALDGFTNYKGGILLYTLLQKRVLRIDNDFRLVIMSQNFHNYLLSKDIFNKTLLSKDDMAVYKYMKNARRQGSWQAFRIPLYIILSVAGIFIFLTQDELYQKVIGLFASIPSLAQMLTSFFGKSNGKDTPAGQNNDL